MTEHPCAACGKQSSNHYWSVDDGSYWCHHVEACEARIAERNDELEKLRNEGSIK